MSYAARFVGPGRAEDVAQRVMLRLLLGYDKVDATRPAWHLVRVATYHECVDKHRRLGKRDLTDLATVEARLTTGIDPTAHAVLARDDWRRVARAVMTLPRDDRRVLVEHVWYGVSLAELARQYGTTETAMRQRVFRLRRRLRRTLQGPPPAAST